MPGSLDPIMNKGHYPLPLITCPALLCLPGLDTLKWLSNHTIVNERPIPECCITSCKVLWRPQ